MKDTRNILEPFGNYLYWQYGDKLNREQAEELTNYLTKCASDFVSVNKSLHIGVDHSNLSGT